MKCILSTNTSSIELVQAGEHRVKESRYSLTLIGFPKDKSLKLYINNEETGELIDGFISCIVDLINKIGYQKIQIKNSNEVLFETVFFVETHKLTEKNFYEMIDFVSEEILWSRNQFFYYNKNFESIKIVSPLFFFNWIKNYFDTIEKLIFEIDKLDYFTYLNESKLSQDSSKRINKKESITYLHNNPHLVNEVSERYSFLEVDNKFYTFEKLVINNQVRNYHLTEHLQMFELIIYIYDLLSNVDSIFANYMHKNSIEEVKELIESNQYIARLGRIKQQTFLRTFNFSDLTHLNRYVKTTKQHSNKLYHEMYIIYQDFLNNYYDFNQNLNTDNIQHLKNIDKIYESFCCYMLADILKLLPVDSARVIQIGKTFKNSNYALYYQSKPRYLKGWAVSDIPDIILEDVVNKKCIIMDCKFKKNEKEEVKGEDIQKMQAYLNNYHQRSGGILYPGNKLTEPIKDKIKGEYRIIRIPLFPMNKIDYQQKSKEILSMIEEEFERTVKNENSADYIRNER